MSEQAWTKEPWAVVGYLLVGGHWKDSTFYKTINIAKFEKEEDAERAFDCYVALLDIADPEAFMAAHDKLVAACEDFIDTCDDREGIIVRELDEALAAVKEAT